MRAAAGLDAYMMGLRPSELGTKEGPELRARLLAAKELRELAAALPRPAAAGAATTGS
jgi:hypothetical protein